MAESGIYRPKSYSEMEQQGGRIYGARAPERITYARVDGARDSALVRRNRTVESTLAQWERIQRNHPDVSNSHNYLRLARAFTNTLRAMDATGRPNPYGMMYRATLVGKRNNRR